MVAERDQLSWRPSAVKWSPSRPHCSDAAATAIEALALFRPPEQRSSLKQAAEKVRIAASVFSGSWLGLSS